MPLYYFVLNTGREKLADREGVEFPDRESAHAHATLVARELMRNREAPTSAWRIEVCDDYLNPCCNVLFADIEDSVSHLDPAYRDSVRTVARSTANMLEALFRVRASIEQVRETMAQADAIISTVSRGQLPEPKR